MRATAHNGRTGKNGTYSVKHNDRNFDIHKAEHIQQEKTQDNWYWHRYMQQDRNMTFEACEKKYYEEHFTDSLEAKNERYRKSGHKERMKTMDEYREDRLSCPEETIYQIGKQGESVDPETLKQVCIEHINWVTHKYPNVQILDVALHVDEATPHIHERKVWVAQSNDGLVVGQAKALDAMGIQRPHPEKKKDRYNNPKVTFTAECRQHFMDVCKEHGLDIEIEPQEASKSGLEQDEYKRRQEQEKTREAIEQAKEAEQARMIAVREKEKAEKEKEDLVKKNKQLEQENTYLEDHNEQLKGQNDALTVDNQELTSQNAKKQAQIDLLDKKVAETQNTLEKANTALQEVHDKSAELQDIQAEISLANEQLKDVLDKKSRASEIHTLFRDKETITYHQNMLESTRDIGREARDNLKSAQYKEQKALKREQQLDRREETIKQKEQDIEPLYQKALNEKEKARGYRESMESWILRTAQKLIKKIHPEQDKLSDKMREFMQQFNKDGKPLDKVFDEHMQIENQRKQQELMEQAERMAKNRDYDWNFDR